MKRYMLLGLLSLAMAGTAHALPEDTITTDFLVSTGVGSVIAAVNCANIDQRIYGYDFSDSAAGILGLYDATAINARLGTGVFTEAYVAAGTVVQSRFPYPRKAAVGLQALFSTATGAVTVYCH